MAVTNWLIDKSAYVRMQLGQAADAEQWNSRIERGLVRVSTITRLEIGFSVRTGQSGRMIFDMPPLVLMPIEHLTPAIDRKSTRLNSSHVAISYAVFCLKKKKHD